MSKIAGTAAACVVAGALLASPSQADMIQVCGCLTIYPIVASLQCCFMNSDARLRVAFTRQTVPPQQLTQMAKPLPKQRVDKGRVWTVFIGGAAMLFIGTVVSENNDKFFPAISRANKAMAQAREASKVGHGVARQGAQGSMGRGALNQASSSNGNTALLHGQVPPLMCLHRKPRSVPRLRRRRPRRCGDRAASWSLG